MKCLLQFFNVYSRGTYTVKVPLLWVMKCSYFGFGSPQQQADMHARSKNTFIVLQYAFIFTLLAQRLPNDSLNDSFFQTLPLRDANLLWLDDWSISFPFHIAVFVSAVLLCVQRYQGNSYFLPLQKRHLVAKNEFTFSFRPTRKLTDGFTFTFTFTFTFSHLADAFIQSDLQLGNT